MDDLSTFCCLNSQCPDRGKRDAGNLHVVDRYGPDKARRLLRCRTCQARFSERKGTALFASTLLHHVHEGCGVRQTARLCGVSRGTVARLALKEGHHSHQLHDHKVAFSPSDP